MLAVVVTASYVYVRLIPQQCHWLYCGKRFARSDELIRHVRIHTNEKNFVCTECSKQFKRSDHLKKHIETHQKIREKNLVCTECGKQFLHSDSLNKHIWNHQKTKAGCLEVPSPQSDQQELCTSDVDSTNY